MYLIFGGQEYYARGPCGDFLDKSEDRDKAEALASELLGKRAITTIEDEDELQYEEGFDIEWTQVIDGATGDIICKKGRQPFGGQDGIKLIKG